MVLPLFSQGDFGSAGCHHRGNCIWRLLPIGNKIPEYFSGPMRYPNAYTCDGSVALAAPMFRKGLKQLSNGKLLMLDSLEVVIYDPLTAQSLVRPLPQTRPVDGCRRTCRRTDSAIR
ncbi:MAG: hypothetical protein IPN95_21085 [Bacteroidetes bacterium]|nr:hypothetical protein [Bacteroidota bacterium]